MRYRRLGRRYSGSGADEQAGERVHRQYQEAAPTQWNLHGQQFSRAQRMVPTPFTLPSHFIS